MMDQKFIDRIEELRRHTYSRITNVQKNICPMVKQVYMNYQFEYWYDGYRYNLWEDDTHIYAVNEIPYCYDNELKNTVFTDTLDNLVAQDKVWPFLLFVNGVAIQWSKITIIHDYDYSYLRIDDITPDYSFNATMVIFPLPSKMVRYGEDRDVLVSADRKGLYFGTDGKLLESTDFTEISIRLEMLDEDMYFKKVDLSKLDNRILEFENLPDGFVPTLENILTFNSDGSYNSEDVADVITDTYNGAYGLFDVAEDLGDIKWAILMYNMKKVEKISSHIFTRAEDLDRKAIVKLLQEAPKDSEIWSDIGYPLIKAFDFDHDRDSTYEQNINEAMKYIVRYDFNMLRDLFVDNTNIVSMTYTGFEFKSKASKKGYVHISRKHRSENVEDVAIMFVNHKLYQYMIDVTYTTNTINIPIFGILNDDHVEIIIFTRCNNSVYNIKVESPDEPVYIHPDISPDECYIMSEECPDTVYDVPDNSEGRKQYIVDFSYTKDGDRYKITFEDPYYYGKTIALVPKRQFRYYRFKQKDGQYKVILPTQFNYCHDPDRYLVFVNGKKIDRTEYTVTIMNKNRPFDRLVLYVSTILDEGDYIDIFYIPEVLIEKYKTDRIANSGLLMLEDEDTYVNYPTTYPLSKYTSMVFVNGLKVNPLDIKDVSLNSMLINVDKYIRNEDGSIAHDGYGNEIINRHQVDSVDNVTILEYAIGNKEVAGYLEGLYEQCSGEYDPEQIDFSHTASDSWKKFINTLLTKYAEEGKDYAGLEKIFGSIFENNDPAQNYKDSFADLRSILYDVVIDYYMDRSDVPTGDKFVYDFETDHFDTEEGSETKLVTLYPEDDKLLDYILSDKVASEEDVQDGKKFIPAE